MKLRIPLFLIAILMMPVIAGAQDSSQEIYWEWIDITENGLTAVHFINGETGFITGMNGTLLKTTDGGVNWTEVEDLPSSEHLSDISFSNASTGAIVGSNHTLLVTTDGGENWNELDTGEGEGFVSVDFYGNTGWIIGLQNMPLMHTSDGGITWQPVPGISQVHDVSFRSVKFSSETNAIVTGTNFIYHTADAGENWTYITADSEGHSFGNFIEGAYFLDENHGFAVSSGVIYETNDGGLTWNFVVSSAFNQSAFMDIDFYENQFGIMVGGNGKVASTDDAGANWHPESSPTTIELYGVALTGEKEGVAVGAGGTILRFSTLPPTSIVNEPGTVSPAHPVLKNNYPNPFNPSTMIRYEIPERMHVKLEVFDITGRRVAVLLDQIAESGLNEVRFNASEFSSGVYFARLSGRNFSDIEKMILLK